MDLPDFTAGMDKAIREIKACEKAEGVKRIYIPGEIELETKADRLANGIPIPDAVVKDFVALGKELACRSRRPSPHYSRTRLASPAGETPSCRWSLEIRHWLLARPIHESFVNRPG